MELLQLKLIDFKNHKESQIQFKKNINCFVGENGSGKTNILDAINYLSVTKSYFNKNDLLNIRFNSNFFTIKGKFKKDDLLSEIICNVTKGKGKKIQKNNKRYKKFSDHIGQYPVIFISPIDTNLIYEGGERRRKYINTGISQYNNIYLHNLISYNKTLKQRNQLLKRFAKENYFDATSLSTYNNLLIRFGQLVYKDRCLYLEKFIPIFKKYYNEISNSHEEVDIKYMSDLNTKSFDKLLKENLEKDRISTFTNSGVHKDDLGFTLNNFSIKEHGSQGQQKSFLISLKLAQFEFITKEMGCKPILLLDDIFDKLDDNRVESIVSFVKKGVFKQIFITDTHKKRSQEIFENIGVNFDIFEVENGKINK